MRTKQRHRRGNVLIEFTLVGIPMIFVLISIFEISRGMWIYHTMAYAIKEGSRYAIVHGNDCIYDPNNCGLTVAQVAQRIQDTGVGLMPSQLQLRFESQTRSIPSDRTAFVTLENMLQDNTSWPTNAKGAATPDAGANPGYDLKITGVYPFRSALAMFWPGAGKGFQFGTFPLPAVSTERIQF